MSLNQKQRCKAIRMLVQASASFYNDFYGDIILYDEEGNTIATFGEETLDTFEGQAVLENLEKVNTYKPRVKE